MTLLRKKYSTVATWGDLCPEVCASPKKIRVVDDNNDNRRIVAKMLSHLGYEVLSADSGESGLSLFLKDKFDVVLSDYEMPGMDGVSFACSIKVSSPETPVVIMTGGGRDAVFSRKSTAVDEVVSKPFTLAEIGSTIKNLQGKEEIRV
jgi:CheY-like chemotaxis protein